MCMIIVVVMISMVVMIFIAMIVVAMIIVVIMIFITMIVVAMIIMVVMVTVIIMVFMVTVIAIAMVIGAMGVNHAVEVFRLSVNSRRSDGTFNGKHSVVGQSPFEDITKLAINGVVLRLAIEVGFHSSMTLNGDHWSDTEFTGRHLFSTTMSAVGMDPTNCSITG